MGKNNYWIDDLLALLNFFWNLENTRKKNTKEIDFFMFSFTVKNIKKNQL